MANKLITATVTGEYIKLSDKVAGAAGSDSCTSLVITFDSIWASTSKIVQFLNAYGENPINITLTNDMLVDGAYVVDIRSEPLEFAGEINVTIRGVEFESDNTTVKRVMMSASTTMKVLPSFYEVGGATPVEPTPTQAEQLLASVNSVTGMTVTSETLPSGSSATVTKTTNPDSTINLEFGLPTGSQGAAGRSVTSVEKTSTVGLVDTYTITFSDSTTTTFSITNGYTPVKGTDYFDGATGNGIASVTWLSGTHAEGTSDTYRITFTNATTFDFTVYNGADGEGANNYTHPTGDGNLHVPATGTTNSGKVLTAGATEGSLSWQAASGGLLPQIVVTIETGSSVTCTDGTTTLNGTSNGTCTFNVPNYGTWTITATLSADSATGSVVVDTVKKYALTLGYYKIYGFTINEAESNPATSVTYTDEATAFAKGSSAWDTSPLFINIKPCLFNAGAVVGYLQRNDYTKFENGTAADITSGNAGDVMVEIPKMAYYMEKSGNIITCKVLIGDVDAKTIDAKYSYLPFSRNSEGDRDKVYVGAYLGYDLSSKLRSLSGKTPTANQTIGAFRTLAQANGTGYQQLPFYQLTLLQILYIMKYGSLNGQVALGRGYVDGNAAATTTGGTNSKEFCFGETTGNQQMKIFGIEDFWGNLYQWIDGLYCNASWTILTTYKSFNDTGSGYLFSNSSGNSANTSGYITKSQGGTQTGFNTKVGGGSETTYFADSAYLTADCLPLFGGSWSAASNAGAFRLSVNNPSSDASGLFGARLCYI